MALHHIQLSEDSTTLLRRLTKDLEMSQPAVVARALRALEREEKRLQSEASEK